MRHEVPQSTTESPPLDGDCTPREAALAYFGAMSRVLRERYGHGSEQARLAGEFAFRAARDELGVSLAEATAIIFGNTREALPGLQPGAVAGNEMPTETPSFPEPKLPHETGQSGTPLPLA